uniref:long-chain-fatty-acid--CoA ligase n=1 Tax=Strongyloides papillosus TaxID=174720 RepID=A0A0N5C4B1_STREA
MWEHALKSNPNKEIIGVREGSIALACFKFGLPVVTVYSTLGCESVAYASSETNGKYLFTNEDQLNKLEVIVEKIKFLSKIIYFKDRFSKKSFDINKLKNILKNNSSNNILTKVDKNDPAVIKYTSGTSGTPKGTILTHQNLIAGLSGINSHSQLDGFLGKSCKVIATYLPLAHFFQLIVDLKCLSSGIKIGYCTPHTLINGSVRLHSESKSDLEELKPTSLAKKDLVKLSHGEYISLGKVESKLISNIYIDNVCLYVRPDRSYTIAIIVPNKENIEKLDKNLQVMGDFKDLCERDVIKKAIIESIQESISTVLNKYEIPKKIILSPYIWTSNNGLITDAMKIKRKAIEKEYFNKIIGVYIQ